VSGDDFRCDFRKCFAGHVHSSWESGCRGNLRAVLIAMRGRAVVATARFPAGFAERESESATANSYPFGLRRWKPTRSGCDCSALHNKHCRIAIFSIFAGLSGAYLGAQRRRHAQTIVRGLELGALGQWRFLS
jgi:hypothetical protein